MARLKFDGIRSLLEQSSLCVKRNVYPKGLGRILTLNRSFLETSQRNRIYTFYVTVSCAETDVASVVYFVRPTACAAQPQFSRSIWSAVLNFQNIDQIFRFLKPNFVYFHIYKNVCNTNQVLSLIPLATGKVKLRLEGQGKNEVLERFWPHITGLRCKASTLMQAEDLVSKTLDDLYIPDIRRSEEFARLLRQPVKSLKIDLCLHNFDVDSVEWPLSNVTKTCRLHTFFDIAIPVVSKFIQSRPKLKKIAVELHTPNTSSVDFEGFVAGILHRYKHAVEIVKLLRQHSPLLTINISTGVNYFTGLPVNWFDALKKRTGLQMTDAEEGDRYHRLLVKTQFEGVDVELKFICNTSNEVIELDA